MHKWWYRTHIGCIGKKKQEEVCAMLNAVQIAEYFLSKDPDRRYFNKHVISKNGRDFYEGNARLNKYLHISQNLYIAKTGQKLFSDDLYAYDNGAVAVKVQQNYSILTQRHTSPCIPDDIKSFLDKIYIAYQNATLDELIEISHDDDEWIDKHVFYKKDDQRMDSLSRVQEYKEQYGDMLKVLDRMKV